MLGGLPGESPRCSNLSRSCLASESLPEWSCDLGLCPGMHWDMQRGESCCHNQPGQWRWLRAFESERMGIYLPAGPHHQVSALLWLVPLHHGSTLQWASWDWSIYEAPPTSILPLTLPGIAHGSLLLPTSASDTHFGQITPAQSPQMEAHTHTGWLRWPQGGVTGCMA